MLISISFRCLPGTNVCVTPFTTVVTTELPEELPPPPLPPPLLPPPPPDIVLGVILNTGTGPVVNKVPFWFIGE